MMNPDTNKFEPLAEKASDEQLKNRHERRKEEALQRKLGKLTRAQLVRPDGSPVPDHWSIFTVGEEVAIKNYTFKIVYIGETSILFEPVGPVIVGERTEG